MQIQENILRRNECNKIYLLERIIVCLLELACWELGVGGQERGDV